VDRRWNRDPIDIAFDRPARIGAAKDPLVHEHREHLLGIERIPLGRVDDAAPHALLDQRVAEQGLDEFVDRLCRERLQIDQLARESALPDVDEGWTSRAEEQQRRGCRCREPIDQVQERRFGPMQVLPQDHDRALPAEDLEETPRREERLFERERPVDEPDRGGNAFNHVEFTARARAQAIESELRRVSIRDPGSPADDFAQGPEGDASAVGQAAAGEHDRLAAE
jgi:hypothetical protein